MKDQFKDPDAELDYPVDWADWLQDGEEIAQSSWIVPEGLTAGDGTEGHPTPTFNAERATVWLRGGTAGQSYVVTNRVTTNLGRTDDRSRLIKVIDR